VYRHLFASARTFAPTNNEDVKLHMYYDYIRFVGIIYNRMQKVFWNILSISQILRIAHILDSLHSTESSWDEVILSPNDVVIITRDILLSTCSALRHSTRKKSKYFLAALRALHYSLLWRYSCLQILKSETIYILQSRYLTIRFMCNLL